MSSKSYHIGNMDCANCAREVESGVGKLEGVRFARVDFATSKLVLEGDVPYEALRQRVEALGKTLSPIEQAPAAAASRGGLIGFWDYLLKRAETRFALVGGGLIAVGLLLSILGNAAAADGVMIVAMLVALYPVAKSGLRTLAINREFNINLLMSIAAIGAIFLGEYLESATVIFLFALGEALEGYTADRARNSLRSLIDLAPREAILLENQREVRVPVTELRIDDRILIKPGERIPMDGLVIAGESSANQAPITGESIPVIKTSGDSVYAGSINGEGALEIRVTQLAEDNTLSRIIKLVEEAQSVRAPSQRMIDRFAHRYTPAVVILAALVAFIPPILFNAPFYDTAETHGWLYRALSMLVIACPCALVISTPVTIISAITAAARRGVLIKGGAHLEALGTVRAFAFDKTGTLTQGQPIVMQSRSIDCETGAPCASCDDVLALAAAVERRSAHPLAHAVVEAAESRRIAHQYTAESVETLSGRGVRGIISGKPVTVGSHSLFDAEYPHPAELCALVRGAESQGRTAMLIADGDRVRGFISVADAPRANSAAVIANLHQLGLQTIMLTGDNAQAAQSIGREIGVGSIRAELLPGDKVEAVRQLLRDSGPTAMIGDGINDTPALAAATVGIAMGGAGSAQALETADIALMADDLAQLPYVVRLARQARVLIRQNVILSFGMKAAFLLLAIFGGASLWMAVFADVGMSLIVTLNGMRPLRLR